MFKWWCSCQFKKCLVTRKIYYLFNQQLKQLCTNILEVNQNSTCCKKHFSSWKLSVGRSFIGILYDLITSARNLSKWILRWIVPYPLLYWQQISVGFGILYKNSKWEKVGRMLDKSTSVKHQVDKCA